MTTRSRLVFRILRQIIATIAVLVVAILVINETRDIATENIYPESHPQSTTNTPTSSETETVSGTVVRIADGDTITIAINGDEDLTQSVRLLGIDTPEVKHGDSPATCGGPEAKTALIELLPIGSTVNVIIDPVADRTDRYDRLLGYVHTTDGLDINHYMVAKGWGAAWYPRSEPTPTRYNSYADAMATAHDQKLNNWELCPDGLGR